MSYSIIRMQKFKRKDVKGIETHTDRLRDSHSNPDIDKEKTHNNYKLLAVNGLYQTVKAKIQEIQDTQPEKKIRTDAVVMAQLLVTSDNEFFQDKTLAEQKQYFQDSLEFIQARYGNENVLDATVHMDERTPHMHVNMIPRTKEGSLCAKNIFTREELRGLQTDFNAQVGQKYGLRRGEEGGKKRHLPTKEFKRQKAKELDKEINELEDKKKASCGSSYP